MPSNLNAHGGPGVDIKQLGGYVLAPASNHASGGVYKWISAPDAPIAEAPAWLIALGWERGSRATVALEDEDQRTADDATLNVIVETVEPEFVHGKMHHICKYLAAWMKQRGYALADVNYVIKHLPCVNTQNGLDAAKDAFRIEKAFGWNGLRGLLGDAVAQTLDQVTPSPRRAAEQARVAADVAAMEANAVLLPERAPLTFAVPLPAANARNPWPTLSVSDIFEPLGPVDYVIEALDICVGAPALVAGYGFSAKSISTQEICMAIACGDRAFGLFPVKQGRAWRERGRARRSPTDRVDAHDRARLSQRRTVPNRNVARSAKSITASLGFRA